MSVSFCRRTILQAGLQASGMAILATRPQAAGEAVVTIDNFAFVPAALSVPAGTRVTWINRDDIPHVVVDSADARRMRSPPLDTGDRFGFVFTAPGSYRYYCALHPHMQGRVQVT